MKHGRRDTTHTEVRERLRALGCSVYDTGDVGRDFPDLVVGFHGRTYLVEVKGPKGKLSTGQSDFARDWRGGSVVVLRSSDEAQDWWSSVRNTPTVRHL